MATSNGNAQQAKVEGIFGATGCGKTFELLKRLRKKKRRRTLIWSPKEAIDNYAGFYQGSVKVSTVREVLAIVDAAGTGEFHIVFEPRLNRKLDTEQFDVVCRILKAARDVTVVVDEMHTVTLPTWSPDGWNQLVMMGRGYGVEIFGLSQRPASVDKNFFGNLSRLRVGRVNSEGDVKTLANALCVPADQVRELSGYMWIERDMLTGKTTRG